MVMRIHLEITVRKPPAIAVARTTALILYDPSSPPPSAPPASATVEQPLSCAAALKLQLRPAEPHEVADGLADNDQIHHMELEGMQSSGDCSTAHITLADGSAIAGVDARLLARQSLMLRTLFASRGTFRETSVARTGGDSWNVNMDAFAPDAVRGAVGWVLAAPGAAKRDAAAKLLTPDLVVEVARCCHYLGIEALLEAALRLVGSAIDERNAPSVLLLARQLENRELERQATLFMLSELDSVLNAEYWSDLPPLTRETLRALRDAHVRNPLLHSRECGFSYNPFRVPGGSISDPRELLGIVRESLAELRERFEEASARQAMELERVETSGSTSRLKGKATEQMEEEEEEEEEEADEEEARPSLRPRQRQPCALPPVDRQQRCNARALERQAVRIRSLERYLFEEEDAFARILSPPAAGVETAGCERTAGWAPFKDGGGVPTSSISSAPASPPTRPAGVTAGTNLPASPPTRPAGVTAGTNFVPSYEWQAIGVDVTAIPAGLEVELPLDGVDRLRRARIPPSWRLAVWISAEHGFWRTDVRAGTTVSELRRSVAAFAGGIDPATVLLGFGARSSSGGGGNQAAAAAAARVSAPLDDDEATAEQLDLFNRRAELVVSL